MERQEYPLAGALRFGGAELDDQVRIGNINDKGLYFYSNSGFPISATVEVVIALPKEISFYGQRRVRNYATVTRVDEVAGKRRFGIAATIHSREALPEVEHEPRSSEAAETSHRFRKHTTSPTAGAAPVSGHREPTREQNSRRLERRQYTRYSCIGNVQFRNSGSNIILSGELIDLSLVGCYVRTSGTCHVGATLEIVLQASDVRIHAYGRVNIVDVSRGMGIEFTRTLDTKLKRLPKFVKMIRSK